MAWNTTRWAALSALPAALGCDPHLPLSPRTLAAGSLGGAGGGGGGSGGEGLVVSVEPEAPIGAAPRVLRLHARMDGFPLDPARLSLVKGAVGPRQLEEMVKGTLSATLEKRLVPALAWAEEGGEALAPQAPLDAGAAYTLVMADVPVAVELSVATDDPVPLLPRIWPPPGQSGSAGLAVWCAPTGDVPGVDAAVVPAPSGLPGRIQRGVVPAGAGARCLRFEADPEGPEAGTPAASVPPPLVSAVGDPSAAVRLDPRPLQVDGPAGVVVAVACSGEEVRFGPGCVRVADDRLYGRSTAAPLLWAVAGAGTDTVVATGPGDPFVITGLTPSSTVTLDVASLGNGGVVERTLFTASTLDPQPHVVINEVLAWPLGPQPAQEWVEIVNDGPAPAQLGGYILLVGSGATPLPDATLASGAFALVVDQDYSPTAGPDAPPAPGTLLLTVPHLGKKGLSNAGVALVLLDGDGNAISSFPAKPRPKLGSSVARRSPSAPDALPGSFALSAPSPGRNNGF